MQCPKCNTDNTQRLEVVFHGGTQDISTTSATVGGAHGGAFGIGGALTKTNGQSQSMLAQKASPPVKKSYKWPVISLLFGLVVFSANSPNNLVGGLFVGGFFGGIGAYFLYSRFQFNSKRWPGLYQHWLQSWLCNKCGTIYHHA